MNRIAIVVLAVLAGVFSPPQQVQGQTSSSPTGLINIASWFSCMDMPNDFYPNAYACDQYIICANQVIYVVSCASGLVYNAVARLCDWPSNVPGPCGVITTPLGTTAGSTNTGFCQTRNDGYYRVPNNCNAYIHCTNHQSVTKYCSTGLVFHESRSSCDFPVFVPECSNYRAP